MEFPVILAAKYLDYLFLGYGLAALIFAAIIWSIWWRYRTLSQDEVLLDQLQQEEQESKDRLVKR